MKTEDATKLREVADWFDKFDESNGVYGDNEVQTDLRRIADEIEASQFRPTWISVKERLPDKYGRYFVCRKDGKIHWEIWNGCGWAYNNKAITHWMPLPSAPEKGGEE